MSKNRKRAVLFLVSQEISLFGSSVVQFAIIWFVTNKTSSGAWVSAMTVAAYIPQFIISFFAGVWADIYPRKVLIMVADSAIALATLALALLMPYIGEGTPILTALVIISVIRSVGAGIQAPAVNSAIPLLVPEDKLMKFNGINSTFQSLVQFAAPAVAGAVLTYSTIRDTLFIDIITAVVGVGIISLIAIPYEKSEKKPSMVSELTGGIKYAVNEHFLGSLFVAFGFFIFLCVPAGFLATLFVNRCYGDTYWYMTLTEVTGFIGMAAGGILMSTWGGFKNRIKTLVLGVLVFGSLAILMGIVKNFCAYLVLMGLFGVGLTTALTSATTFLQEIVTSEMQGRMFGLFNALYSGFLPLGMVVFGPLSDVVSMREIMVVSGVLLIVLGVSVRVNKELYYRGVKKETNVEQ